MKESILKPVKEPIETKEYIDDFKAEEIKNKWKLILAQKDKTKSFEAFNRFSDFGAKLRKKYSVDYDLSNRNIKNQMNYADSINAKKVIFIGEEEIKSGMLTVKDMKTRQQSKVSIDIL